MHNQPVIADPDVRNFIISRFIRNSGCGKPLYIIFVIFCMHIGIGRLIRQHINGSSHRSLILHMIASIRFVQNRFGAQIRRVFFQIIFLNRSGNGNALVNFDPVFHLCRNMNDVLFRTDYNRNTANPCNGRHAEAVVNRRFRVFAAGQYRHIPRCRRANRQLRFRYNLRTCRARAKRHRHRILSGNRQTRFRRNLQVLHQSVIFQLNALIARIRKTNSGDASFFHYDTAVCRVKINHVVPAFRICALCNC